MVPGHSTTSRNLLFSIPGPSFLVGESRTSCDLSSLCRCSFAMSGWADNDMENGGLSGKGGKSGPPVKHPKDKKQPTPETTVRRGLCCYLISFHLPEWA